MTVLSPLVLLLNNVKRNPNQISNFQFLISNETEHSRKSLRLISKQLSKFKFLIKSKIDKILIFLLILFLPTQLGKHFWPDFSFVNSIKIDYYSPTIYFWDLILVIAVFYFLVIKRVKINKKALAVGIIFIVSQTISLISATNIGAGVVRLEQLFIMCVFGILIASLSIKNYSKEIYWGLILGVLIESTLSVIQFMLGHSIGFWILGERTFSLSTLSIATFNYYGQIFLRPYGTFPHPN